MKRCVLLVWFLCWLLIVAATAPAATSRLAPILGTGPGGPGSGLAPTEPAQSAGRPPTSALRRFDVAPAAGIVHVVVWLQGDPLVAFHEKNQPALEALHRPYEADDPSLEEHRQQLAELRWQAQHDLSALGFETDGEADTVLHALFGRLPEAKLSEAAAVPGVRTIHRVHTLARLLDGALPIINAFPGWDLLGGEARAGRGTRVGILDTGVDVNHPMLQDFSTKPPEGFPKGELAFTNNKVIVARNYIALLGDLLDTPNAMDRDGHGTFVAAMAAGRRVVAPQGTIAGVAPGALVGNYRLFSSPLFGSLFGPFTTDAAIIAALDDAVRDGMQVVNLSLGGLPADLPSEEPLGQAVKNTVKAGVVVVAAAGNDGPSPGSVAEPASIPEAIGVGASNNARIFAHTLQVTGPGTVPQALTRVPATHSDAPPITDTLGPLPVFPVSTRACSALASSERVESAIAVIEDGSCTRSTKIRNASNAGARAVLITRIDSLDAQQMSGLSSAPIPAFQLARSDGVALRTFFAQSSQAQATINPQIVSLPVEPDRIAPFSSPGPSIDMELKPDLVAPGTTIYSAMQTNDALGDFYNLTQFGTSNGTSFSSPLAAGAALLVRQRHPDWSPAQVKSALVNTAANVVRLGAQQAPLIVSGNGRLDVAAALGAAAAFDPVGLSFSSHLLAAPLTVERRLTLTNLASTPESFHLAVEPRSDLSNGSIQVDPTSTAVLRPREPAVVRVTFTANPPVNKRATADGRIRVSADSSGLSYTVPYWGEVVDGTIPSLLVAVRGDGQTQPVSTTLAQKLVVAATDNNFVGVGGVPVKFSVTSGGGKLDITDTVTDFTGMAAASFTLGNLPGINRVDVAGAGDTTNFIATARANPQFTRAGVALAATFSASVAPGSIVSLFGAGLSAGTAGATALPLPLTVAGAQVLANGSPAPLFFASPGQINFQLPFELEGQTSAELRVTVLNTPSPPVTLPLVPAAPGLFTVSQNGQGTAIAIHISDFSAVTSQNPVRGGELVAIFGTGLGPVTPAVASGSPAPSNPPASTKTTPTVRLGGAAARVQFSGLAPFFAGLYQVNFEVPPGLPSGDVPLVLSLGNASSNTASLPMR